MSSAMSSAMARSGGKTTWKWLESGHVGSLARGVRRHDALRGFQPPQQSATRHQQDCNQLRSAHQSAENLSPPRIATQKFQEETGGSVQDVKRSEHLAVKFLAFEHPGQNNEVGEFHGRFEKLGGFQRHIQRS